MIVQVDNVKSCDAEVRSLLEMFPSACAMEAQHCLQLSVGDLEQAALLMMDRQDTGQAITSNPAARSANPARSSVGFYQLEKLTVFKKII